ncbi:MAG: hypothetical protein HYY78_06680, partial [Betaproteobacteria bacterium]|nr:hypothetical protein [Betaproteobacteria bacterium]
YTSTSFSALPSGFNLIATADNLTPSAFTAQVDPAILSVWSWDAVAGNWYFYSPLLEATGGLAAVKAYADGHGFLHFQDYNKTLGVGTGFWVNRP